jgi:hypothetical protein
MVKKATELDGKEGKESTGQQIIFFPMCPVRERERERVHRRERERAEGRAHRRWRERKRERKGGRGKKNEGFCGFNECFPSHLSWCDNPNCPLLIGGTKEFHIKITLFKQSENVFFFYWKHVCNKGTT